MSDQQSELELKFTSYSDVPSLPSTGLASVNPVRKEEVNPAGKEEREDPDAFIAMAKFMVIDNYNAHRNPDETPALQFDEIFVITASRVFDYWEVVISSKVVKGLLWIVNFDAYRSFGYIGVFKKINNIRVPVERS